MGCGKMGRAIRELAIAQKHEIARSRGGMTVQTPGSCQFDELTLTEIAHTLNYSSVSHLSNQFKKITGLTPTSFKRLKYKKRTVLEHV